MATKIRLKRIGRKNRPFYRLVVMDERARRDGAAIEQLGWFNPLELDDEKNYALKQDRVLHWLQEGAQTTETVHNLLKRTGLAYRWHLSQQGLDEAAVEKEMKKWALEREEVEKIRTDKVAEKVEEKQKAAEKEAETAAVEEALEDKPADVTESDEAPAEESKAETEAVDDTTAEVAEEPEVTEEEAPAEETPAEETVAETTEETTDDSIEEAQAEETPAE